MGRVKSQSSTGYVSITRLQLCNAEAAEGGEPPHGGGTLAMYLRGGARPLIIRVRSREEGAAMAEFIIRPHGRLHDWIADELGYFREEGLAYRLVGDEAVREALLAEIPQLVRYPIVQAPMWTDDELGHGGPLLSASNPYDQWARPTAQIHCQGAAAVWWFPSLC